MKIQTLESRFLESYIPDISDLGVFRVLFASTLILNYIPIAIWLPLAPQAFFNPPIGIAALYTRTPNAEFILALNLLLAIFSSMLLSGCMTRLSSLAVAALLLTLNSWSYSMGKINHDILFVLTPAIMAYSDWGRSLSIDRFLHRANSKRRTSPWPLALLALLIAFGMFSSGWAKSTTGWLDPNQHCTRGHLILNYYHTGRVTWLSTILLEVQAPILWKVADWSAVLLELAFLPACFHRHSFRIVLAAACLFHLGVLLLFDIAFYSNIIVYSAFIPFTTPPNSLLCDPSSPRYITFSFLTFLLFTGLALGCFSTFAGLPVSHTSHLPLHSAILWSGACIGTIYLANSLRLFLYAKSRIQTSEIS